MPPLVLLRHGQSQWNVEPARFTGWVDVDLSEQGKAEAVAAGRLLRDAGIRPDVAYTSTQRRAIHTADLVLHELGDPEVPVRPAWQLNERHYGALQGRDKKQTVAEFGEDQVQRWRRSYAEPPLPISEEDRLAQHDDLAYADVPIDALPASESLADVVARLMPYWSDVIVPELAAGKVVLVVAHGNSLRALVKHLDGLSEDQVVELNIPTGIPLVYDLDERLRPIGEGRYLGDPDAVRAATKAVEQQTG